LDATLIMSVGNKEIAKFDLGTRENWGRGSHRIGATPNGGKKCRKST
jgi:hypothetical protein